MIEYIIGQLAIHGSLKDVITNIVIGAEIKFDSIEQINGILRSTSLVFKHRDLLFL